MANTIVVTAHLDRLGNLHVRPINERWRRRFQEVVRHYGGPAGDIFLDRDVEAFIEQDIPRRYHRDLRAGWDVHWRVDPWVVGHWYGWDAHTAAE